MWPASSSCPCRRNPDVDHAVVQFEVVEMQTVSLAHPRPGGECREQHLEYDHQPKREREMVDMHRAPHVGRLGVLVLLIIAATAVQMAAQDWPQWRGPNRDGVAASFKEPASWPEALKQ